MSLILKLFVFFMTKEKHLKLESVNVKLWPEGQEKLLEVIYVCVSLTLWVPEVGVEVICVCVSYLVGS